MLNQINIEDSTVTVNNKTYCDVLREKFKSLHRIVAWKEEGFFDDVDLMDISCHWLQFDPIRKSYHLFISTVLIILFLIGSVSNALVTYIILSSKQLRKGTTNVLLANLAVSDTLIIIVVPIFVYNSFYQGPAIGGFGCKVYGFLGGFSGTLSICTLAAVAIERYLVISRPLATKKNSSWAYKMIAFIWIYSAIFASLPLFGFGNYVPEGYLTSCSFDYLSDDLGTRIFILSYFIGAWVCPLAVITFCYANIIHTVYTFRKELTRQGSQLSASLRSKWNNSSCRSATNTSTKRNRRMKKRSINVEVAISKVLIQLVAVWIIAWTPYTIVSLLGISGFSHLLTPFSSMLPAVFAKTAACVNPFIYSLKHPEVRKEILRRLHNNFLPLVGHRALPMNDSNLSSPLFSRRGVVASGNSNPCPARVSLLASIRRRRLERDSPANSLRPNEEGKRKRNLRDVGGSRSFSAGSRNVSIIGIETTEFATVEIELNEKSRRLLAFPEIRTTILRRPSTSLVDFNRQSKFRSMLPDVNPCPIQSSSV